MGTKLMKWLSILTLLAGLFLHASPSYRLVLEIVICVGALVVVAQAFRTRRYLWAAGFILIAVLFNPAAPVALSTKAVLAVELASAVAFGLSLAVLRTQPIMSIPGIIHPHRRIESL